ncbi:hypothetical protein NA56DRAFT_711726 [Hyaloscypha hepaticicola]|uniref:Uncharacterized protein n=1 Tax=Hyaloscypha hepaticicola TaxID=2082293 RepID=A0A2J6PIB6_9HELO|nr:hypothetical protein NA56DRAFT_711726 [Hyaloscypha hepaticicola]
MPPKEMKEGGEEVEAGLRKHRPPKQIRLEPEIRAACEELVEQVELRAACAELVRMVEEAAEKEEVVEEEEEEEVEGEVEEEVLEKDKLQE